MSDSKQIIVETAESAGLQVVLDEGAYLILGDEIFAGEFGYTNPVVPPYGVVIGISFHGDQVASAYKKVSGNTIGFVTGDSQPDPDERLKGVLRLIYYQSPSKKPIFLLSGEGKTTEELADEAWEAVLKYREAKAGEE